MRQSYDDLKLISTDTLLRLYMRHAGQRNEPIAVRLVRAIKAEVERRPDGYKMTELPVRELPLVCVAAEV